MIDKRIDPGPNQESVWDYPRPPIVEPTNKHIQIIFADVMIADTTQALRVLETSHPPVYYLPQNDILMRYLSFTKKTTVCEWKGEASYFSMLTSDKSAINAAWTYLSPKHPYEDIRNYIAFYPSMMDVCMVDKEIVVPQPGKFYGGWITRDIVGPFKGEIGSLNW